MLWESAGSVPARRQRRLFDDTKEAEKVMSLLTSLTPGDMANMLNPTLLQVFIDIELRIFRVYK